MMRNFYRGKIKRHTLECVLQFMSLQKSSHWKVWLGWAQDSTLFSPPSFPGHFVIKEVRKNTSRTYCVFSN